MGKFINLTGQKFGKLLVIDLAEKNKHGHICWNCICECENKTIKIVSSNDLRMGKVKSCGCGKSEATVKYNKENKKKYNRYNISGEFGIGYTSNTDTEFYFDLEDYEKIKNFCWSEHHKGYIYTNSNKKYLSLHQLIMNFPPDDKEVDHLNRNKTDNRKLNLVICEHQRNMVNQPVRINNTSGVNGVTWDNQKNKWHSCLMDKGKMYHLGFFDDLNDAIYIRLLTEKEHNFLGENRRLWKEYGID